MAKIDEKKLNTPNLFLVKARHTLDYLIENRKRVFLAVGVAVGVVLIAVSWYLYRLDYESKAQKLYAAAFNYYHSAQTDYAGDAAVPQSVEKYREVVEKFPGTKAAGLALFSLGNVYYRVADYDRAVEAFQDFLKSSAARKELKSLAFSGLGYCYEEKGQLDKAVEAYESATNEPISSAFSGMTYMNIGRVYEKSKDPKKALDYYMKASEQKNDGLVDALVKRKIAELSS